MENFDILDHINELSEDVAKASDLTVILARCEVACNLVKDAIAAVTSSGLDDKGRKNVKYYTFLRVKYAYLIAAVRVLMVWLDEIWHDDATYDTVAAIDDERILHVLQMWHDGIGIRGKDDDD